MALAPSVGKRVLLCPGNCFQLRSAFPHPSFAPCQLAHLDPTKYDHKDGAVTQRTMIADCTGEVESASWVLRAFWTHLCHSLGSIDTCRTFHFLLWGRIRAIPHEQGGIILPSSWTCSGQPVSGRLRFLISAVGIHSSFAQNSIPPDAALSEVYELPKSVLASHWDWDH